MLYTSSDTSGLITRSPQLKGVRKLLAGLIYKCKMHAPCPSRLHEKDRISCDYRHMWAKLSVCHESSTETRRTGKIQSWLIYPYTQPWTHCHADSQWLAASLDYQELSPSNTYERVGSIGMVTGQGELYQECCRHRA